VRGVSERERAGFNQKFQIKLIFRRVWRCYQIKKTIVSTFHWSVKSAVAACMMELANRPRVGSVPMQCCRGVETPELEDGDISLG